jgi:hypothetical protein
MTTTTAMPTTITYADGTIRARARFGAQNAVLGPECPSCAVAVGEYHDPACEFEICCRCGRPLGICNNNHEWNAT